MTADLAHYVYQGEIGRGAMAIVWRGWDSKLERVVAIKEPLLPPGTPPERAAEMASRFVVEGRTAARLSHPGLVAIYDADVWNGRAAIVMEYVEGETLAAIIDRSPLPVPTALAVVDQLLDAAAYAHANGVVHRDIKPDNVFVTSDGRIKLCDFGVARVTGGKRVTQVGAIVGTPGYMAPEQILGQATDERADLFSVGVMAYEMLTGSNPFGATDGVPPTDIMRRVVHDEPPALAGRITGVSADLQSALEKSLQKRPERRFRTAGDMLIAFRRCAGSPQIPDDGPLPAFSRTLVIPPPSAALAPLGGVLPFAEIPGGDMNQRTHSDASMAIYIAIGALVALLLFMMGAGVIVLLLLVLAAIGGLVWWLGSGRAQPAQPQTPAPGATWDGGAQMVRCRVIGPMVNDVVTLRLPTRIGRAPDVELPVLDEQASRYHAVLFGKDGALWVQDLGSSNGTRLDGAPIGAGVRVQPGQRIAVGSTQITILGNGHV